MFFSLVRLLPGSHTAAFCWSSHGGRGQGVSGALVPFMRAESPRPKHPPKVFPPSTITLRIRCQYMDLGWEMQIFSQFKKYSLVLESFPIFVCVFSCFCSELQWTQEVPAAVMCCLECMLLLTNCSGSDFSAWVVSSSPSSSTWGQHWLTSICLWMSAELCCGFEERLEQKCIGNCTVCSDLKLRRKSNSGCCSMLKFGQGSRGRSYHTKGDSNWSPSVFITG